jgi:hypothetical protein
MSPAVSVQPKLGGSAEDLPLTLPIAGSPGFCTTSVDVEERLVTGRILKRRVWLTRWERTLVCHDDVCAENVVLPGRRGIGASEKPHGCAARTQPRSRSCTDHWFENERTDTGEWLNPEGAAEKSVPRCLRACLAHRAPRPACEAAVDCSWKLDPRSSARLTESAVGSQQPAETPARRVSATRLSERRVAESRRARARCTET